MEDADDDDLSIELQGILPDEILQLAGSFPLSSVVQPSVGMVVERMRALCLYRPTAEKAVELRDIYYSHAAWMYVPHLSSLT